MTAYLGQDRWNRNARGSEERKHENEVDLLPVYGDNTIDSCTKDLESAVGEVEKSVCSKHSMSSSIQSLTVRRGRFFSLTSTSSTL